jgi:hypothetical protein
MHNRITIPPPNAHLLPATIVSLSAGTNEVNLPPSVAP